MTTATAPVRFDEMTDPEIAAALARNPRVILPMGSVEQHGPHLPTGTDFFAATSIALAVAGHIDAVVLPLCPLGVTPMHMPYPGTVSLRPQTLQDIVFDIGSSLAQHGCREFIILNWHEGNIPSVALVAERLHRELGLVVVVVQACYVAEDQFGPKTGGLTHGGKIEAWSVLSCRPELVHLERASGSGDRRQGELVDKLRRDRSFQPVLTDVRTMSRSGWYGSPEGAAEEDAHEFIVELAGSIASRLRDVLEAMATVQPGPGGSGPGPAQAQAGSSRVPGGPGVSGVIRAGQGHRLSLPGRTATELISAAEGGYGVTVRRVIIPPEGVMPSRGPHVHESCEEVIVVLEGSGELVTAAGAQPVEPGDVIIISPGDSHHTCNKGSSDLVSLCFFPVPDLAAVTREADA